VSELAENAARGTGCDLDRALVWTLTECGTDGYFAAGGSSRLLSTECSATTDSAALYGVRCCADTFLDEAPACGPQLSRERRSVANAIEAASPATAYSTIVGVACLAAGVIVAVVAVALVAPRWRRGARAAAAGDADTTTDEAIRTTFV
jgi:hypothetical protein